MMLNIRLDNLLLINIETVPLQPTFSELDPQWQQLWTEKMQYHLSEEQTPDSLYPQKAGLMAEFGRIVCISMAYFRRDAPDFQLRIKSFYHDDEKTLLQNMMTALNELEDINKRLNFTGHNIKEFDIPFLSRRLLINDIPLPPYLDFQNMRPWEVQLIDTFQYWRFGDYKNFTSLKLLAAALNVPAGADALDGNKVGTMYYAEKDLTRIVAACQNDVITVANVVRRLKNMPLLSSDQIVIVP
jgi:3'-5' exonuclease